MLLSNLVSPFAKGPDKNFLSIKIFGINIQYRGKYHFEGVGFSAMR